MPRAVADALAALDVGARIDRCVFQRCISSNGDSQVLVVESDHEAERDLVAFEVVQEAAAVVSPVQRPAGGVHHQAGLGLPGRDLPQLLMPSP